VSRQDWNRARFRDKRRDGKPPADLGAMTDSRRRFLADRQAQLRADFLKRAVNPPSTDVPGAEGSQERRRG
jgi:hypothetical protein